MPIYEDETTTREQLFEMRRRNRCLVCRGALDVFLDVDKNKGFLACRDWRRSQHEGIEREAPTPFEQNIPSWREEMDREYGKGKADALAKYVGQTSLQRVELQDIIESLWPEAPEVEKTRAILLCATYGLNPLNKHVFLIPFNKGEPDETWATVMGIKAKRLLASRRGPFSYIDNTPRVMTEEEQNKVFGEVLNDRLYVVTKLRDPATGAEAVGYGFWPHNTKPKGENKGNTRFNMAAIRSESQALDRLRPGEMPLGIEAVEEATIDADYTLISSGVDGEKAAPAAEEKGKKTKAAGAPTTEEKDKSQKIAGAPPPPADAAGKIVCDGFSIDLEWLNESLKSIKWPEETTITFLVSHYKVDGKGSISDNLQKLKKAQAENFVKEIQKRLENQQRLL